MKEEMIRDSRVFGFSGKGEADPYQSFCRHSCVDERIIQAISPTYLGRSIIIRLRVESCQHWLGTSDSYICTVLYSYSRSPDSERSIVPAKVIIRAY